MSGSAGQTPAAASIEAELMPRLQIRTTQTPQGSDLQSWWAAAKPAPMPVSSDLSFPRKRLSINRCAPRYTAKRRRLLGVNGSPSAERDPIVRSSRVGPVFSGAVSRGCLGETRHPRKRESMVAAWCCLPAPPGCPLDDCGHDGRRLSQVTGIATGADCWHTERVMAHLRRVRVGGGSV